MSTIKEADHTQLLVLLHFRVTGSSELVPHADTSKMLGVTVQARQAETSPQNVWQLRDRQYVGNLQST